MRALTGISDKIHLFLDASVSATRFLGRASHNSVLLLQPGEQTHYHWPLWEGCAKDSTIPWLRAKTNEMQTIYPKDLWQFCKFHNSLSGIVSWFDQISNNNNSWTRDRVDEVMNFVHLCTGDKGKAGNLVCRTRGKGLKWMTMMKTFPNHLGSRYWWFENY